MGDVPTAVICKLLTDENVAEVLTLSELCSEWRCGFPANMGVQEFLKGGGGGPQNGRYIRIFKLTSKK